MNYYTIINKCTVTAVILLLSFGVAFADGCDDLTVMIENNTGLTINSYYTDNSLNDEPTLKVVTVPPYNRDFNLPLVINRGSLPLVYTDIVIKAEAEQTWLGVDNVKTKIDQPLHDKVISVTKFYTRGGALDRTINFFAANCQRINRFYEVSDNGKPSWKCLNNLNRAERNHAALKQLVKYQQISDIQNFDSSSQKQFKVQAEVISYGYCGKDNGQPAKVVIQINPT